MTRRLIEDWLPIAALGEESVRERRSMTALPPTYYLHVWWARRPLVASRAAVLASLLPADADRCRPRAVHAHAGDSWRSHCCQEAHRACDTRGCATGRAPAADAPTPLPPHMQRVVEEWNQLDNRLAKLRAFLTKPEFFDLPASEQYLLTQQRGAMQLYLDALSERLRWFGLSRS